MSIKSAFYLSIAVHALRNILGRVLRPSAARPSDWLVFASPKGHPGKPPYGFPLVRLPRSVPSDTVATLCSSLAHILDRATVTVTTYDLLHTPLCTGWTWTDYHDVPKEEYSSSSHWIIAEIIEIVNLELRDRPFEILI